MVEEGWEYLRISACVCAGWIWDFCIKGWSAELWEGGFPSSCGQFSRNIEHHSIEPRTGKHGVIQIFQGKATSHTSQYKTFPFVFHHHFVRQKKSSIMYLQMLCEHTKHRDWQGLLSHISIQVSEEGVTVGGKLPWFPRPAAWVCVWYIVSYLQFLLG